MTRARRAAHLLVAFGAGLVVAAGVLGWTWQTNMEGSYSGRGDGGSAYAGVFAVSGSLLEAWSWPWLALVLARWVAVGLAVVAVGLLARRVTPVRVVSGLGVATAVLALVGLVVTRSEDVLFVNQAPWLGLAGGLGIVCGAAALRVDRD